jgi:hypothetical protein
MFFLSLFVCLFDIEARDRQAKISKVKDLETS